MARKLSTDAEIDDFIEKVLEAAEHHGGKVKDVILPLSEAVRARLNLVVDTVSVYERNGELARTCWVTLSGKRYAFSYDYADEKIDLRDGSIQGANIAEFDNHTSRAAIKRIVANL